MDLASIVGLVVALALMIYGMGLDQVGSFLHTPSALITFGGALGAILASNTIKSFLSGLKTFLLIFKSPKQSEINYRIIKPCKTRRIACIGGIG